MGMSLKEFFKEYKVDEKTQYMVYKQIHELEDMRRRKLVVNQLLSTNHDCDGLVKAYNKGRLYLDQFCFLLALKFG